MDKSNTSFSLKVETTEDRCPIGEKIGNRNQVERKIPVFSCEGACIRGEIARVAANLVAKNDPYRRGCHGEMLTVPDSAMAKWVKDAEKVILIDGCFLRCHGRILENLISKDKLVQFDALSHYKKYTELFDIESVPENERQQTAQDVANWIISSLEKR